jgi:ClpP class serine protease
VSPLKNQDPSTPDGLATLQRQIDELGYYFVNNIAKFRNTTTEDVLNNYGKGDILISYNALKAGMIDGISNFHQVKADFINLIGGEKNMSILSKFKAQSEDVKPEEKETPKEDETLNAANINIEWLKKNKSEIVRQLQEEGAGSERERIKSLCDTEESMPDEDKKEGKALFNSAKFEKPRAGVEVLGELFLNKQKKIAEMRENYLKDSEAIPPIKDAAVTDKTVKAEKDQLLNYALDYLKKKMGVK